MNEAETYTIKEAAELTGLPADTLRYYEKIGLLPHAERRPNSHRLYRAEDLETMRMIACYKKTGLSLESMKPFLTLRRDDPITDYPELVALAEEHKRHIEQQIASLQQIVVFLDMRLLQVRTDPEPGSCTLPEPPKGRPPV
ncbi:MerR family transcriptional regulator [Paenibacillus koleovorans]|uniref:MerR family transcriptional regulator n=1 Tax=Paenibacillus koleovorans TaxID=121608 RepID=UPI000FD7F4F1|nr:MerR family transcriptional regulator [Paenibacillus koleovorans]